MLAASEMDNSRFPPPRIDPLEKAIRKSCTVNAGIDDVWEAWTTQEGVQTFFAPEAGVDFRIGGSYEMYFSPERPRGSRGGEGNRVLSYLPKTMVSFEWNGPPSIPSVRDEKTWVVVQLEPLGRGMTVVKMTHCGWGEGKAWEDLFEYFTKAWDIVLARLQSRFSKGPIDWDAI
ncbi:SRPBCC domain-containing protein [Candidatus Thorarchaeota archaeon]|nr:MAG: SRPBCC domain-containing protein [Candidatus Thorarchaeota archaeon]